MSHTVSPNRNSVICRIARGDTVLLVYPPCIDFLIVFLSCLRAGIVAVPVYPPYPSGAKKNIHLFAGIQKNCSASVVLCNKFFIYRNRIKSSEYMRVKQLADIKNVFSRISSEWPSVTWRCTDSYVSDLSPCEIPDGFHSQAKSSSRRTCSLLPCVIPLLPSIHFRKHFLPERRHDRHFQPSLQHGHHHLRSARRFFFHRRELASPISRYGFDRIIALPPWHLLLSARLHRRSLSLASPHFSLPRHPSPRPQLRLLPSPSQALPLRLPPSLRSSLCPPHFQRRRAHFHAHHAPIRRAIEAFRAAQRGPRGRIRPGRVLRLRQRRRTHHFDR
ncbi:uncharacterized protein [Blastocystis hominis]|uniref:AMP-dependent synthetase/ligase domain-containing protein n=1 Tax=Blastocystis hominis TaxID=12968 RepID=D8MA79_BLAHO|nr:uncharacterized protein [Blastocystis hominis]CBK24968.2 unnamed protein product [Blastocystis hominis]|eukprot:XP_012899016.1 uncharacterized protein [Blastocystis hominis]